MFDFLSWGHLLVIALAALFIFGPERLPTLAADAGRGLRRLRETITAVREQVSTELGEDLPDLRELDVRQYHPRTFLRAQLFGDDGDQTVQADRAPSSFTGLEPDQSQRAWAAVPADRAAARETPPPFDVDAT